jgi:uncharacterized phage protein (TIGR01671 family)
MEMMMKEIKHRGYNPNILTHKMIYGSNLFNCTRIERGEYTLSDFWELIETGAFSYAGQYTSLKDKNGKEVYEGDVIKHRYYTKYITAKVAELSVYGVFFHIISGGSMFYTELRQWTTAEIIGNIMENPELLEVKK